jgi:glycosyltransferase involved in cell wall biosynthesis
VVCSEGVGTCRDLVEEGGNGFVVPTGDTAAFARRVVDVLGHPRRAELGRRAREVARAWDFRAGVESLVERLDRLVQQPPPAATA